FDALMSAIQDTFGKACVLFNAPIGHGGQFSKVVSVLNPPASPPPGGLVDLAQARSKLVDAIVESDEALMEKYLTEGDVSADELKTALPKAIASGTVVPVFFTAAKKDLGIDELLDSLTQYALSPSQAKRRTAVKGTGDKAAEVQLEPSESGEYVGQVFKVIND